MSETSPRWVHLTGVVNMRDVGGLPTMDGRAVQSGRLLRSDNLQDLSDDDVNHLLDTLAVTDIVDLRTTHEVESEGPGPLRNRAQVHHHHHSLLADTERAVTAEQALAPPKAANTQRRDARFWSDHYLGYLTTRPDSISAALAALAHSRGATIVHCAAGKDRTGTVVGIALDAVGVQRDAIIEDYALTGERLDLIIDRLVTRDLYSDALRRQRREDQVPRPESMQNVLHYLLKRWGGSASWLRAQGWTAADLDRLTAKLVS